MQHLRSSRALQKALDHLSQTDADIAQAIAVAGRPQLRERRDGFSGLVSILISQQVSTAAARAIEARLFSHLPDISPAAILALQADAARACGLSAQKYKYIQGLAHAIHSGTLKIDQLQEAPDEEVRASLTAIKGIGPWTADIYLMFCLRRADSFAPGDLALQEGLRLLKNLPERPRAIDLETYAEIWRPHRAAAALVLWRYYAHRRSKMAE